MPVEQLSDKSGCWCFQAIWVDSGCHFRRDEVSPIHRAFQLARRHGNNEAYVLLSKVIGADFMPKKGNDHLVLTRWKVALRRLHEELAVKGDKTLRQKVDMNTPDYSGNVDYESNESHTYEQIIGSCDNNDITNLMTSETSINSNITL